MMRTLRYLLEAALFWMLIPFVWALGLDRASWLFGRIGRLVGPRTGMRRTLRRRIKAAMPEKDDAEVSAMISDMWEHLSRLLAELIFLERFSEPRYRDRVEICGEEYFQQAASSGRGVFLLAGHLGNWELIFPVLARLTGPYGLVGVYRPLNNVFLDKVLLRTRRRSMERVIHENLLPLEERMIPKTGDQRRSMRALLSALQKREGVILLVDQRTSQGIRAKFFGQPAMTTHMPAQMAINGGHILLPISIARKQGVNFLFRFHEPISAEGADVLGVTQKINDFFEARIRERPEQWLWLHNRWRP
ncbi:MAG: hypothetical protein OXF29_01680 [Hyphomicrobiales bacterium]|nr:hypothetical protein [Hyphomicrobiales bacterium]